MHCQRFSTAATRRCLGSVSVPVVGAMLSHPLGIFALVSHYLTNKLIPRRPLLRRNLTFAVTGSSGITHGFPWLSPTRGYVPAPNYPVCRCPHCDFTRRINHRILARLACLIHADNVHSEPGSNPSNDCLAVMSKLTTEQSERKVDPMHPSQDGCKDHTATVSNVNDQSFSVRLLLTRTES